MGQRHNCAVTCACVQNTKASNENEYDTFILAVNAQNKSLIERLMDCNSHNTLHHNTLLDVVAPDGDSVLHIVVKQQNINLVQYFLSQGVSPNRQNQNNGDTPLHIASRLKNAEIIELLIEYGANKTMTNHHNETSLSIVDDYLKKCQKIEQVQIMYDAETDNGSAAYLKYKQNSFAHAALSVLDEQHETDDIKVSETKPSKPVKLSKDEVAKHNSLETGIWIIIGGIVYDITLFIKCNIHPASNTFLEPYFGKDATEPFDATFHSIEAVRLLNNYEMGELPENEKVDIGPLKRAISRQMSLGGLKSKNSFRSRMRVSAIYLYPVKGMKGFQVQKAQLTLSGFVDDRIYAVVNKATKKVVNQLTHPRLSLINVAFPKGTSNCDTGIQLNDTLVPFIKEKSLDVSWKSCTTKILVYDQGEEISKWITSFLDQGNMESENEFIFVRIHEENYRETEEFFALPFATKETQKMSAFQNYAPVLLASEESLNELNRRYKEKDLAQDEEKEIGWDRFRMNIIVKGVVAAHYEDFMKHIAFGYEPKCAEILWTRRRYFCAVPQVNQNSAENTQEPLGTARRYRNAITLNDRTSLPKDDAVFFGSLFNVKHDGVVQVGQNLVSEHERLEYDTARTAFGKSYYGLTEQNLGSQFYLNYHTQYEDFELIDKEQYNHDTIRIRFKMIAKSNHIIRKSLKEELQMGDHYLLKFVENKQPIIRSYTPLFDDSNADDMTLDLLVKVYPDGKMTQHLSQMKIGDTILCKKNYGKVCYFEVGKIRFGDPRLTMFAPYVLNVNKMNLIAAGSGITPIYQILFNIHLNKEFDDTQISVLYANKSVEDVLLKDKLEDIMKTNPNIKIHFVVGKEPAQKEWTKHMDVGRITLEMCKKHLFPPDAVSLLCGPSGLEQAVKKFLFQIGFDERSVATF